MRRKQLPELARVQLVRHLAAAESLWRPLRHDWASAGLFWTRQQQKRIPQLGGGLGAERERVSYWQGELINCGLMTKNGLTAKGKRLARSWTWTFDPPQLKSAARRLLAAIKRGDVLDDQPDEPCGMVPDSLICGTYWSQQQGALQRLFTPWLTDGVLVSRTDVVAYVYYGLPDPSVNLIRLAGKVIDPTVEIDSALVEVYEDEFKRMRALVLADKPTCEIGPAPLGLDVLKSGRDSTDPRGLGIKPLFENVSAEEIQPKSSHPAFEHLERLAHLLEDVDD